MLLRLVLNTAVYVLAVFAVVAAAINPAGTARVLRRQAVRAAAAVRTVTVTATASEPIVAASEIHMRSGAAPAQTKSRTLKPGEYRVAIGTLISARLRTTVDSRTARANDQVDATLTAPVTQDGVELIPVGSIIHGRIVQAEAATKKAPLGRVELMFTVVQHADTHSRAAIETRALAFVAEAPPENGVVRAVKRQPIDVVLEAGRPIAVVLSEPLLVYLQNSR